MKLFPFLVALLILIPSFSYASASCTTSREFTIPQWQKGSSGGAYQLIISNISNIDIDITVSFFYQNGNLYTESVDTGTQFSFADGFSSNPATGTATLSAGESGKTVLQANGTTRYGHAKVKWEANTCLSEAVQVTAIYFSSLGMTWIEANAGLPF